MSFSNTQYLYEHLPAGFRREDASYNFFLRRFVSWFGDQLDAYDREVETFFEKINPDTAPEEYLNWWLWSVFGWGWFPEWFTPTQKRDFYRDVARHYARRGTRAGIEEFLADFGIRARVTARPAFWGEFAWGEEEWAITGPLGVVVRLFPTAAAALEEFSFWGEFAWGEDVLAASELAVTQADVDGLLRFQWPLGNFLIIEDVI